jgi:hypothetical protein
LEEFGLNKIYDLSLSHTVLKYRTHTRGTLEEFGLSMVSIL